MQNEERIVSLQRELADVFRKTARYGKMLGIGRLITYGLSFLYFIFIIYVFFSGGRAFVHDYEANPNPTFWEANQMIVFIIPAFVLITLGGYLTSFSYTKFVTIEKDAVRRIIRQLFPDATCSLGAGLMSKSRLNESLFFGGLTNRGMFGRSATYGSLAVIRDGKKLVIHDIGITESKGRNLIEKTQVGGFAYLLYNVFRLATVSRMDSAMCHFRGLFSYADLEKELPHSVVILPDHLECHLDYMAQTIQSMKTIAGNKLVVLENPDFERYFSVYSSDEVFARYILTPAMMERMTTLRKKYNRDILLSFNGNRFYFAVSMPEGFLTLGNDAGRQGVVGDLYDNVETALSVIKDLRL